MATKFGIILCFSKLFQVHLVHKKHGGDDSVFSAATYVDESRVQTQAKARTKSKTHLPHKNKNNLRFSRLHRFTSKFAAVDNF